MGQKSDRVLVQAVLRGDVDSFTELCRRYYAAMVAIAHAIVGDGHLAEDVAQETFAKACRHLMTLKDHSRFAPWLATICRNQAKTLVRRDRGEQSLEDWDVPGVEPQADPRPGRVREAIEALPDEAREVIYLRYYDELSYLQMAGVLGLSQQAVNGRLRRARSAIAAHLARTTDNGGRP